MHDADEKVAIIGMGRTGQAVAAYLSRRGIRCEGFDERRVRVPETVAIPLHIGKLDVEELARFSRVIVSPGVNWRHPVLGALRERGVPVGGDLDLFNEVFDGELIAVTGSNGKTTTVTLIGTMLDTLPGGIETAGNIGRPMLDVFEDDASPARVVLELSSFQLERASGVHPRWAILLNIQPDHADMHADAAAYEAAKCRIFASQQKGDTAMLPSDAHWDRLADDLVARDVRVLRFGVGSAEALHCGVETLANGQWRLFWRQEGSVEYIPASELPARGMHQHLNLAVAAQVAAEHQVSPSVIRMCLTTFPGLPHRLQALGVHAGREWFDDSKATNPDAAMAALASFDKVIWICGGVTKGVELSRMLPSIAKHVAQALIIGKDPKPFMSLCRQADVPARIAGTMEKAVHLAARGEAGLPVLLAPAAASQDQFRDYAERGRVFAAAVMALEEGR